MSYRLEQSARELAYLKGAKVARIYEREPEWADDQGSIVLVFDLAVAIEDAENPGVPCKRVEIEVLQDPEGNGPGFLALTDITEK